MSDKKPTTGARGGLTTVTTGGLLRKTCYFEAAEWRAIRDRAEQDMCTAAEVVRRAVREYVEPSALDEPHADFEKPILTMDADEYGNKVTLARSLVRSVLAGAVDKGGRPLHEHCERVGEAVAMMPGTTDEQHLAAYLHDVLEGAEPGVWKVGLSDAAVAIATLFGDGVAALVLALTRESDTEYSAYIRRLAPCAVPIKIADLRDNLSPERAGNIPDSLRQRYTDALAALERRGERSAPTGVDRQRRRA